MNIKIKNIAKISCFLFLSMTLFLISASLVNAQCTPSCTSPQTCQLDTETGTYHCGGGGGGGTNTSITFTNPLSFDTVEGFLASVLNTIRGIIVVLSIIFIIIGGIFYITSAGSESRMKVAKAAITASMIGLAIGIAAPSFLKEISTILGWTGTSAELEGALTLSEIALKFLNFLLSIVGVLAIIMLVVGGIMYLSSAGDDDRIKTAKNIVTYSIIGIIVSLAALVIVTQIATLLSQ